MDTFTVFIGQESWSLNYYARLNVPFKDVDLRSLQAKKGHFGKPRIVLRTTHKAFNIKYLYSKDQAQLILVGNYLDHMGSYTSSVVLGSNEVSLRSKAAGSIVFEGSNRDYNHSNTLLKLTLLAQVRCMR